MKKENFLRRQYCASGQNLLEFGLVLPILLIVVFGVLDLGRVFYITIGLRGAVREGARYYASHPGDSPESRAKEIVKASANGYGIVLTDGDIAITCENSACIENNFVNVEASTQFDLAMGLFFPSPINIEQSTQMMILVAPED